MPDWGAWADKSIDAIDGGIDKAKEKVGEGVDWATDKAGDGLDKVGAHDWADSVEDWGDETASSLGAEVGEQQLGQTEEANELIHGNPSKIAGTVKNLRDFKLAFDLVGAGMKRLDSSNWKGEAANTFREKFQTLPTDWLHAADAFDDAAKALETYSKAITTAQGKAKEAIALYKEGQATSKTATDEHNKKVDAYNAARNGDNPLPRPADFVDPGIAKQERAHEILKEARRHRNEAGETAKTAVTAALAHAPKEPTGRDKLSLELMDYGLAQGIELTHFSAGVLKGTAGLLNFVRSLNPMDPYNLTHPAEYYKGVSMTLAGIASTAANPDRAAGASTWTRPAASRRSMRQTGRSGTRTTRRATRRKRRGLLRTRARRPRGLVPIRAPKSSEPETFATSTTRRAESSCARRRVSRTSQTPGATNGTRKTAWLQ